MRVCPKCGFIDPPYWLHCKFSYHIDSCRFSEFKNQHPELARNLRKGGDIIEDKDNYYRLNITQTHVFRKAKIEWTEINPFGAEKYEKFDHKFKKSSFIKSAESPSRWIKVHPNQTKLFEVEK